MRGHHINHLMGDLYSVLLLLLLCSRLFASPGFFLVKLTVYENPLDEAINFFLGHESVCCVYAYTKTTYVHEPVTKGRDLKWDTLPQNQTPSKLFSVLPLESGMFQVTISIIKKWF